MLLAVIVFTVCLGKYEPAKASSLQLSATYDSRTYTKNLEVKVSVESASELTIFKYAYARVANSVYFKDYEQNGVTLTKNEAGEYTFFVTQNGYVSLFAMNEAGEFDKKTEKEEK